MKIEILMLIQSEIFTETLQLMVVFGTLSFRFESFGCILIAYGSEIILKRTVVFKSEVLKYYWSMLFYSNFSISFRPIMLNLKMNECGQKL